VRWRLTGADGNGSLNAPSAGGDARCSIGGKHLHPVEESETGGSYLLHGFDHGGEEFVGDDLLGLLGEGAVEGLAPGDAEFGVHVNDVDAGGDGLAEVVIVGAGAAVQGEWDAGGFFDLGDALDIEVFAGFSEDHAVQHAVHVADGGGEDIDAGGFYELAGLVGRGEAGGEVGSGVVNF